MPRPPWGLHDPTWQQYIRQLEAERDALRAALGRLADLPVVVTDEYAYRVTEIAHRALEHR